MKISPILALLSVCLTAIVTYAFYTSVEADTDLSKALACSSAASILITSLILFAVSDENTRKNVNLKLLSFIFLLAFVGEHVYFVYNGSADSVIICTGVLLLIYLLIFYCISQIKNM